MNPTFVRQIMILFLRLGRDDSDFPSFFLLSQNAILPTTPSPVVKVIFGVGKTLLYDLMTTKGGMSTNETPASECSIFSAAACRPVAFPLG